MAPERDDHVADGWEMHRQDELVAGLAATPAQRLSWLEEAIAFAFRVGALPRPASEMDDRGQPDTTTSADGGTSR